MNLKLRPEYNRLDSNRRLYGLSIPLIALTGGIATGKSSVAKILVQKGLPLIDADQLVKSLYFTPETQSFIASLVPEVLHEGKINFKWLREIFFKDSILKEKIESHLYQKLPQAFQQALQNFNAPTFLVYDVPLLFEKNLHTKCDVSLLAYAPRSTQIKRLIERDHIKADLAERILEAQLDIEEKKKRSDCIIDNSGDLKDLPSKVQNCLQLIFYT